jgi:hypothetical protein
VLVTALGVGFGVSVMEQGYSPVPFADFWSELGFIQRGLSGDIGLRDFWSQHNEHRILVARIQFLVDYAVFDGTNVFLFGAIAVSSLALAATYAVAVYVDTKDFVLVLGVFAVAAASTMSPAGIDNLTWAFQVQFVQVFMFAALSVLMVVLAARNARRTVLTALSALFAVAATYSMANGLFVWPVVVGLAVLLHLGRRHALALALVGAGTIASFLWGHDGARNEASDPIELITYVAAYVGSAVWGAGFHAAVLVGSVGLVLVLVGVVVAWHARASSSVSLPFGLGVAAFVLLTAGQTALGRLHLGTSQAITSRYSIASFTLWLALLVAFLQPVRDWLRRYPSAGAVYLACAAAATLFVGFRTLPDPDFTRTTRFGREATILTYRAGASDDSGTVTGVAAVYSLTGTLRWLERERLGPFAPGGLADSMRVSEPTAPTARPCLGAVESSESVKRGFRLRGWIAAPRGADASRNIVVLDEAGRRVGLGRVGSHRPDLEEEGRASSEWAGFVAYLPERPQRTLALVLVGEDDRTSVCRLLTTQL